MCFFNLVVVVGDMCLGMVFVVVVVFLWVSGFFGGVL